MRLLLDTHTFLWRLLNDPRLSRSANDLIDDVSNELFLSSATGFEIAIKVGIGKLKLPVEVSTFVRRGMELNGITELPIILEQTYTVSALPLIHRDPFDRLLIAVAMKDDLALLTNDPEIRRYPVQVMW